MVIYVVKNGYYRDTYNENRTAEWGMQISSGRQFHTSDSSWSELHVKRKGKYFVAHNNSSEWTPRKKEIFRSERGSYNNILIIMARHAPVNRSLSWADTYIANFKVTLQYSSRLTAIQELGKEDSIATAYRGTFLALVLEMMPMHLGFTTWFWNVWHYSSSQHQEVV